MANEFGDGRDRYPPQGGKFWMLTERNSSGNWTRTLRTKGDWPMVGIMAAGIEVARFNSHVCGRYPGLAEQIVDALNNATRQADMKAMKAAAELQLARIEGRK